MKRLFGMFDPACEKTLEHEGSVVIRARRSGSSLYFWFAAQEPTLGDVGCAMLTAFFLTVPHLDNIMAKVFGVNFYKAYCLDNGITFHAGEDTFESLSVRVLSFRKNNRDVLYA